MLIYLRMCGLCPSVEWQCCTFEDTDLATLAHLEATATLRSPNTTKSHLKVNFLLVLFVFVRIFLYLCAFFAKQKENDQT